MRVVLVNKSKKEKNDRLFSPTYCSHSFVPPLCWPAQRPLRFTGWRSRPPLLKWGYAKDTNHRVGKKPAVKANDANRAIAPEELSGIGEWVSVCRSRRAALHCWAF